MLMTKRNEIRDYIINMSDDHLKRLANKIELQKATRTNYLWKDCLQISMPEDKEKMKVSSSDWYGIVIPGIEYELSIRRISSRFLKELELSHVIILPEYQCKIVDRNISKKKKNCYSTILRFPIGADIENEIYANSTIFAKWYYKHYKMKFPVKVYQL